MSLLRRAGAGLAVLAASAGGVLFVGVGAAGATPAASGSGTMTVVPGVVHTSETQELTFTYTAVSGTATANALTAGKLTLTVPATWTAPQVTNSSTAGFVASTCKKTTGSLGAVVSVTSRTITVSTVGLKYGASCTVDYGANSLAATAPATAGTDHFTVKEASTSAGTLTALAPAYVNVGVAAPGSGAMTLSPSAVAATSTGNTLTFTYTAAAGGLTHGTLSIPFPTGWPAATVTASSPGDTTDTCPGGGTVVPITGGVEVRNVTLASGASCSVTYGSRVGGGPGLTIPSSTGTKQFAVAETPTGPTTTTHTLAVSPTVKVVSANGSGSMTVTPATATPSSSTTLTFTFTAASGGLTHGRLSLAVPSGWTAPVTATAPGKVSSTCGTVGITGSTSRTVTVSTVTKASGASCTITYGTGTHKAVVPSSGGTYAFTAKAASVSGTGANGTLTALAFSPEVAVPGANGVGTMTAPSAALPASTPGHQLTFTFTAASGGLTHGRLSLAVPSGWTAPVTATAPGKVSSTCGTVGITGSTSRTVTVSTVTKASGASCTITYGTGTHTVSAPSSPGAYAFVAQEASGASAALAPLGSSPSVTVTAPDGSGTLTVSPNSVAASSAGNTLTFTYTAATGGITGGGLRIAVPAGWSPPQAASSSTAGYTTTTCRATLNVTGSFIVLSALGLSGADSCAISYGADGGAAGATAPSSATSSTFAAEEESAPSSGGGVLAPLAVSPTVAVSAPTGGAPSGSSSSSTASSSSPTGSATATDSGNTATASGGKGTVTIAQYPSDPVHAPTTFTSSGEFFDLQLSSGSTFSHVTLTVGHTDGGTGLYWWDPTAAHGSGAWEAVSPVRTETGSLVATLDATSSPTLKQLTGTVFAVAKSASAPPPATSTTQGYWLVGSDGGVFSFGDARYFGSVPGLGVHVSDVVGMASTPDGKGYWLVGSDGGVFSFGDARYFGSVPGLGVHVSDIVGMASTPTGSGYWVVAADGRVLDFGNALAEGTAAGTPLAAPVVGAAGA